MQSAVRSEDRRMAKDVVADVIIRPARAGDLPHCAEIFLAGRRTIFPWIPPERFHLGDFEVSTAGEEVWVAELDGRVVGFASIFIPGSFVHNLFVEPSLQRQGIGRQLLDRALERLPSPVKLKCCTANTPARTFYLKTGWVEDGTGTDDFGPYVVYRK